MRLRVYLPWQNLGCLGLRVGRLYVDIYRRPCDGKFALGLFVNTGKRRYWIRPGRINTEG